MPHATVLYFGILREQRGTTSERVPFEPPTTVGQLYERLFAAGPQGRLPVGYACNDTHVDPSTLVHDGDEVAFLPPVGGG